MLNEIQMRLPFSPTRSMSSLILTVLLYLLIGVCSANAEEKPFPELNFIEGPATVNLGSKATFDLPEGYIFFNGDDVRKYNAYTNEPSSGNEIGAIIASEEDGGFEVYFSYRKEGYIEDKEKTSLDSDSILQSIKKGNDLSNKKRLEMGGNTLTLLGWEYKPYYNDYTKNLEWATRIRVDRDNTVLLNHNTRLLGRKGYVSAIMICEPAEYDQTLLTYQAKMNGFNFVQGERYADFRKGDKVAKYGLTALITGGAVAVAAKAGLFKYVWKILVGIGIAVVAAFGRILGKK